MPHAETSALGHEWAILQDNHEQAEKSCLLVKLAAVVLLVAGFALALHAAIGVAVTLVLWVQEGMLRTSQSRLGDRLLRVEQLMRQASPQLAHPCQLHTEWLAARPGFAGLLAEYAKNMLRPTVAFPYVVLVLMEIGWAWNALG